MSSDIQSIYENTMTEFYTNSFIQLNDIKVTLIYQLFDDEEESQSSSRVLRRRDRSLQTTTTTTTHAAKPLFTLLQVTGTSEKSPEIFDQLEAVTKENYAYIIYLLKAADPIYFESLTLMNVYPSPKN